MNDIKLLGRLTGNPELKQSASGRVYAWFTVAVPRQNNRVEEMQIMVSRQLILSDALPLIN